MEILFVFLIAASLGLIVRVSVPGRDRSGIVLVPAIAAGVGTLAWVAFTWLGWAWDGGVIWWVSLGLAAGVSVLAALWLGRTRAAHDDARFAELAGL